MKIATICRGAAAAADAPRCQPVRVRRPGIGRAWGFVLSVAMLASGIGPALADVVFSEPFQYPIGQNLNGQNGGTGFSGAWSGGTSTIGNPLSSSTGSSVLVGSSASFRPLTASVSTAGTSTYLTFLMQSSNLGTADAFAGLSLYSGATEKFFVGIPFDSRNLGFDTTSSSSPESIKRLIDFTPATATPYLVILGLLPSTTIGKLDVKMWATSNLAADVGSLVLTSASAQLLGEVNVFSYDRIRISGNYPAGTLQISGFAAAPDVSQAAAASVAASFPAGPLIYSRQGIANTPATAELAASDAVFTLGKETTPQDRFEFTLAAGAFGATPPKVTCRNVRGEASPVIGYVSRADGTLVYRVTSVAPNSSTIGAVCTVTPITVVKGSLAVGSDVTLAWSAKTPAGAAFDGGTSEPLARLIDQYVTEVTRPLNGVVDVYAGRESFTSTGDDGTHDTLVVTVTDEAEAGESTITAPATADFTRSTVRVAGNFGHLAAAGGRCTDASVGAGVASGTVVAVDPACAWIDFRAAGPVSGVSTTTVVFKSPLPGVKLPTGTFTATTSVEYAPDIPSPKGTEVETAAAGAWTINGASVDIPYMPYGANISQIIYAANRGLLDGAISVQAFNQTGQSCDLDAIGTVPAGSTVALAGAIKAGLEGCPGGFLANGTTGRVALRITVTVPAADIEVYSAYNVGGSDRGTVVNDSNGRKVAPVPKG